jgi:hypothetical protein
MVLHSVKTMCVFFYIKVLMIPQRVLIGYPLITDKRQISQEEVDNEPFKNVM